MTNGKYNANVSLNLETIKVQEIHFHLGDILPNNLNYSEDDTTTLKVIMHYSNPYGKDCSKTITLPATVIL